MSSTKQLATVVQTFVPEADENNIRLLVASGVIPENTPPQQIALYFAKCADLGLNPMHKQVHLIPYGQTYVLVMGIHAYRALAQKEPSWVNETEPLFDGMTVDEWVAQNGVPEWQKDGTAIVEPPKICTLNIVTFVHGKERLTKGFVTWRSRYPKSGYMSKKWQDDPFGRLAKCAAADGLRRAYANTTGKLYIHEDFDKASREEEMHMSGEAVQISNAVRENALGYIALCNTPQELAEAPEKFGLCNKEDWFLSAIENRLREIEIDMANQEDTEVVEDVVEEEPTLFQTESKPNNLHP